MGRYWLTPPNIYKKLDDEFHFSFDPCPFPNQGVNGCEVDWGDMNYVNPPFTSDGKLFDCGPTAFVRKAIAEQAKGRSTILLLPTTLYTTLLIDAGAEFRNMGRIKWLETDTKEPMKGPPPIMCVILRGSKL